MRSEPSNQAFSLSRVHPAEWLTGIAGVALMVGLVLPWSDGEAALASPGLLDLLLSLAAVVAVLLPLVVASSARTNVPIVYETGLWVTTLLFALIMMVKVAFPPDGGYETGFWLSLVATVVLTFAAWRSVAREF